MTEQTRHPSEAWIGKVVAEKYRINRCLGIGGHGAVFEAENAWTGRRVALKLLLGPASLHPEISERFLREARAATRVQHPNIIEVLDMGRDAHDGTLYIVQELLEGEDFRDVLRRERTLDPHQLIELLAPVMDALAAAHAHGIVHRDLKPANIFLARRHDGRIAAKLIDFGVSRMSEGDHEANELTHTGALLGTPDYMSPEQARGERTGPQSDVWAMGVVLYESLAGQRPYRAANYNALLIKILADDAPRLAAVVPGVPEALADVVHGALARDPARRYATMQALRGALLQWASTHPRLASGSDLTPSMQPFPALDLGDATPVSLEPPLMTDDVPAPVPPSVPVSGPQLVSASGPAPASHPAYASPRSLPDATDESPMSFAPAPLAPASPPAPPSLPRAAAESLPRAGASLPSPSQRASRRSPWFVAALTSPVLMLALWGAVRLVTKPATPRAVTPQPAAPAIAPVHDDVPSATPEAVAVPITDASPQADALAEGDASTEPVHDAAARVSRVVRPARPAVLPSAELPDRLEIRAAFQGMSAAVSRCVNASPGTILVAVTVLGTGRVESVQIPTPYVGTPGGNCIAALIRRARLTPFRRERFTFTWPYVIPGR